MLSGLSLMMVLASCQLLGGVEQKPTPDGEGTLQPSLAQEVVDEYLETVQADASRSLSGSRGLTSSDVTLLKAEILKKIGEDGVANTKDIAVLMPFFMGAVQSGIQSLTSMSSNSSAKGHLLGKALEAGAKSLTKTGRLVNFTQAPQILAALARKSIVSLNELVTDVTIRSQIVSLSVEATFKVLGPVANLSLESVTREVTVSLVAEVSKAGNSDLAQGIAMGVAKGLSGHAEMAVLIKATVKGALIGAAEAHAQGSTGTTAGTKLSQILAQIGAGLASVNTGVTLDSTLMDEVISDSQAELTHELGTDESPVIDVVSVITAVNESLPVAVLTITKSGSSVTTLEHASIPATLILDTTGSTSSGVDFTLTQSQGPLVSLVTNGDGQRSVIVTESGTYTFNLVVKNTGGTKSASAQASFTISEPLAVDLNLKEGLVALQSKQYDLARTKFVAALVSDPQNQEAKIWSAYLDLLGLSVNTALVDVLKNRIGVVDYPSTLDELLGDKLHELAAPAWFKATYYRTKAGIVPLPPEMKDNIWNLRVRGRYENTIGWFESFYDSNGNYVSGVNKKFIPDEVGEFYSGYFTTDIYVFSPATWGSYVKVRLVEQGALPGFSMNSVVYSLEGIAVDMSGKAAILDANGDHYSYYALPSAESANYEAAYTLSGVQLYSGINSIMAETYFAQNPQAKKYIYYYNLPNLEAPVFLPKLNTPAWVPPLGLQTDAVSIYPSILLFNILDRNPTGLNTVVDNLLTSFYGEAFESILNRIASLSDDKRIVISSELLAAFGVPTLPAGITVSIGKPEMLALSAQLKVQKAFFQYLASANLDYPWNQAFQSFSGLTSLNNSPTQEELESWMNTLPGLFSSQVLRERSVPNRSASKATFLSALGDIRGAALLMEAAWADSTSYYRNLADTLKGEALSTTELSESSAALVNARKGIEWFKTAIDTNGSVHIPISIDMPVFTTSNWVWPTESQANTMEFKPGALWSENMLDIRNWFASNSQGFIYSARFTRGDSFINSYTYTYGSLPLGENLHIDMSLLGISETTSYISVYPGAALNMSQIKKFLPAADEKMFETITLPVGASAYKDFWNISPEDRAALQLEFTAFTGKVMGWINK